MGSLLGASPCLAAKRFKPSSLYQQHSQLRSVSSWCFGVKNLKSFSLSGVRESGRRTSICAVSQDAEEAFKKTVEVDRLIDLLRHANPRELQKIVGENILVFNEGFWMRLAARTDTCKSEDDKKDYEELALSVMSIVDHLVHKTNEKIESSTDVLKEILKPVVDKQEEITWPPRDPSALEKMEKMLLPYATKNLKVDGSRTVLRWCARRRIELQLGL